MLRPDSFVIVRVKLQDEYIYRIFSTWNGGYLYGSSWRLNSGITKIEQNDLYYVFYGYNGNNYECKKGSYRTSAYSQSVLDQLVENASNNNIEIKVLTEDEFFEYIKEVNNA